MDRLMSWEIELVRERIEAIVVPRAEGAPDAR
jgi:hypothetical protein